MPTSSTPTPTESSDAEIVYTNWKGHTSTRHIQPRKLFWGSNEWHPEPQWLLRAWDVDKQAERTFAMKGIHIWR